MFKHAVVALGTLAAGLSIFSTPQAFAFTAAPQSAVQSHYDQLMIDVRARGGGHYGGYSGHYNGYRNYGHRNYGYRNYCNSWNHNCGYHRYNNYYGNPWWGLGGIGLGFGLGYGAGYYGGGYYNDGYYGGGYGGGGYSGGGYSRHAAWCLNRYRSYNPRTNTWVSYSGRINQCISPYRN